jgi:transcriptional regulator with XRE-family HTH domain
MKVDQNAILPDRLIREMKVIGERLARLRVARRMTQNEAAVRSGLSRTTAYRLEKGDAGLAFGQVLRYIDAIAPGTTLLEVLQEDDPALAALTASEKRRRVRGLTMAEKDQLDF